MKVLDGETLPATPATIAATPTIAGVMQYVAPLSWNWPKALTPARLQACVDAHLPIAFNYETDGKSWRGGRQQGYIDGGNCNLAMHELGLDKHLVYYSPADENVPPNEYQQLHDCIQGFNDARQHLTDAYLTHGEADFCRTIINRSWQINARGWYNNATDDPAAALIQRTSHSYPFPPSLYDESDLYVVDWGQYPLPVPPKKAHDMFQLVQISDAPTPSQKAAVWQLGGAQRSWVQSPQTRDMLILFAAQQGLPTNIGTVTQAQISGIPIVGPEPQ